MKRTAVLLGLLLSCGSASAVSIGQAVITGADMAGMKVTANFSGGGSETATWATTGTDATVLNGEGFKGAASGTGWSLAQQGYTLGNYDGTILGLWTLSNDSAADIDSIVIDALAGDVVFDKIGLQTGDTGEYTPGSNRGRGFQLAPNGTSPAWASYSNLVSDPDLYGTLTLDLAAGNMVLSAGDPDIQFLADTDAIPEPPVALLMMAGLVGLLVRKRTGFLA